MSRYKNPSFSRDNGTNNEDPEWYSEFVNNLNKNSVHSRDKDVSLFYQINQVINGKQSKYSTVEEAISAYQKLTGLTEYLNRKEAQLKEPELFHTIPEMKIFIDNYVKNNPNFIPEAIVEQMLKDESIRKKLPNKNEISNEVRVYIADKLKEEKQLHPVEDEQNLNLGKQDLQDTEYDQQQNDPFSSCMPNKKY